MLPVWEMNLPAVFCLSEMNPRGLSSLVLTLAVHGLDFGKMVRLGAPVVNCPVGSAHPRLAGVATLDSYISTVAGGGVSYFGGWEPQL